MLSSRYKLLKNIGRSMVSRRVSFGPLEISEVLSQRLQKKGIYEPTEIQEKAMESIMNKKDVIVNSETGSGKTLCYLLPILQQLKSSRRTFHDKVISVSRALILTPSMELANQIGNVCKEISDVECNVACGTSPLCVKDNTEIIVTIPAFVMNYQWQSIKNISCIVFDEVDVLLVQQFSEVKNLLEFYTGQKVYFSRKEKLRHMAKESRRKYSFQRSPETHQLVFVGATIPAGGRKSTLSLIERYVPSASLIRSSTAHKAVESATFEYMETKDDFDAKVINLVALLEEELIAKNAINEADRDGNICRNDFSSNSDCAENAFRVIVYLNKTEDAKKLFENLTKNDRKFFHRSKYFTKDFSEQNRSQYKNHTPGDVCITDPSTQAVDSDGTSSSSEAVNLVQFREKWKNRIRILHRDIDDAERLDVLNGLSKNEYNVLITTDLAARGLDIPDVDIVIQFDFASNVVGILHRAGRTARAGAKGKVVSFITEKNKDLHKLFLATVENNEDVTKIFSRRRRLRRRIKEGKFLSETVASSS